MKQTIVIERKSVKFVDEYVGNARVLRITKRQKNFVAFIKFETSAILWFCEKVDQARRESNLPTFVLSKDDGNWLISIKERMNAYGEFLKISKVLCNGKEFIIIVPCGKDGSGEIFFYSASILQGSCSFAW